VTDLSKGFVSSDIPLFKINNPDVTYYFLKYTQTYPLGTLTLIKSPNMYYECYLEAYYSFETVLILMTLFCHHPLKNTQEGCIYFLMEFYPGIHVEILKNRFQHPREQT
jgi:hypothetical protein